MGGTASVHDAGGGGHEDYPTILDLCLDNFEKMLKDRWEETVHRSVSNNDPIPPTLHDRGTIWNHQTAEVWAHITYGETHGGCAYLNWYADGRNGKVQNVVCEGIIRMPTDGADRTTISYGGETVEVPESFGCRVGELFAAAEEWAWQDRKVIFDDLPKFAIQNLDRLKEARDVLLEIAGLVGAEAEGETEDPAFIQDSTIMDVADALYLGREKVKGWQDEWTGRAASVFGEGFAASTKPTLINHGLIACGLSTLVNQRATIIDTYRANNLSLIRAATQALGLTTEHVVDLSEAWKLVQASGRFISKPSPDVRMKIAGWVITVVGWLGKEFFSEFRSVEFTYEPGEVARMLYDQVWDMKGSLDTAEEDYTTNVQDFRDALNGVPSYSLELYDLTQNSPTGSR